ncbi:biotin--[acetyl-CoA-carboxylase] ligase [Gramella sp. AN32]|uniref:Biotin--[acetyl-CoA-carboxylase] ligase n=1 Tax=Christiangramia antarctica TaxID=2058158 RepID=A0ABW5X6E5_9FLAO|nr:biotin--[acetyl-CoA-carboxylase] ligase [Gramella sp. AN32]MCM4155919.1 biotin--[acetyl-CoA-carboxylase] ligase [Gramella sp. AN32]
MRIIKVNAIDSTNSFVRKFYAGNQNFQPVCVVAEEQTKGRGQFHSTWESEKGKNLTFSILYPLNQLKISHYFLLSSIVSIAVLKALEDLQIPNLSVKWPNDIMSANYKIGGILIENIIQADIIAASVIGIGLNVNQTDFEKLPNASSLRNMVSAEFNLDHVLEKIISSISELLEKIKEINSDEIITQYERQMFRINKVSAFELQNGVRISGMIKGVSPEGKLKVETEGAEVLLFDLKEIKLLY